VQNFPVHDDLRAASPANPVLLTHASGHASMANAKAMELAGVTRDTKIRVAAKFCATCRQSHRPDERDRAGLAQNLRRYLTHRTESQQEDATIEAKLAARSSSPRDRSFKMPVRPSLPWTCSGS
jgi:predicted amidohydrolase YtcJ